MARKEMQFPEGVLECIEATRSGGSIVCAGSSEGVNGMTIGWINIGSIWGRPIATVLIRPSRHTFKVIEAGDSFTVNVMPTDLKSAVMLFGSKSGRDMDKFEAAGITPADGLAVKSPYIAQADLVIECRIAFKQPMDKDLISAEFVREAYSSGDYHTIYYGEIVSIHKTD